MAACAVIDPTLGQWLISDGGAAPKTLAKVAECNSQNRWLAKSSRNRAGLGWFFRFLGGWIVKERAWS
jgi:hypothetical protein